MSILNTVTSLFKKGSAGDALLDRIDKLGFTKEEKADLLVEVYKEEKAERDSARAMYSIDNSGQIFIMKFICWLYGLLIFGWIVLPAFVEIDTKISDRLENVVYFIGGMIASIVAFYFGSSAMGNSSTESVLNVMDDVADKEYKRKKES